MWSRFSIIILFSALGGCASLDYKSNELSDLPPTATGGDGSIVAEVWSNIGGRSVRSLTRHERYPEDSNSEDSFPAIDFSDSQVDKFGRRVRALLSVDQDGPYQFRISADDSAEFWLATDAEPRNKRLLAFTNRPTGYKIWNRYKTQLSPSVQLSANSQYFVEIIHKDGNGEDYLILESAYAGGEFNVVSQDQLSAYVPVTDGSSTKPGDGVEAQQIHETAYHAGYASGLNQLAYDASYPMPDQDQDGIPDFYEVYVGTNPADLTDAIADADGDALTNYEEYLLLSDTNNQDSDGDSIADGYEVAFGLNPLDATDAAEDADSDGHSNLEEYLANTSPIDGGSYPAPVSREVVLSWQVPTERADGTVLAATDIERYKVYAGDSEQSLTELTDIMDSDQISLSQVLGEGTHYYAISTVTYDEGEGPISSVISVTIN